MSAVLRARSALGHASRRGDAEAIANARRDLAAAKIVECIERSTSDSSPLTDEQVDHAVGLLHAAREVSR